MHKKLLLYFLFFYLPLAVQGQSIEVPDLSGLPQPTQAKALRYWFDDDTEVKVVNQLSGQQTLDVSELLDGLHTLNYQIVDDKDIAAYISTSIFIKMSNSSDASTPQSVSYWFDDNSTDRKYISSSGIQMLDASNLTEGLHTLNYQVICSDGTPAYIYTSIFMKTKGSLEEGNVKASRLLYWFDDNTEIKHADMAQSIQLLDASELHDGLHTLHYQVQCENGDVTPVMSAIFMRLSIDVTATSAKSLRYWFDDDASTVNVISVTNGTQTLNVADLPIGMHTLNYQLIDSNGNVTPTVTRMFLKQFDKVLANSQNGIVKYEYWLNEHSTAMQSITLADAPNPYTLIALLPMQKEPLNTLNFHYEANNGNPMIYAKNEFHIRFHDAAGYWVDESKPFIDYSIYKEVNPVGEISATQTFPKVAQNDIRWYTMQSAPGDTAAFKLSQPATIQVFAPSGEEVFKTSAAESVKWDGIHTWEDGTYYIAVHDVTGTQSTMKLEYMHMDKYDVVNWNVRKVGNGGCSTITFKGNGFRDLYAVDLHGPGGEIISSVNVGYISDAETAVSFDFTGAKIGKYNAVFHFTEEDKRFAGILTVEEAVDIKLSTNVTFSSSFISGSSTTYTIDITNMGNMTAYDVPLEIRLSSENFSNIKSVNFRNINGENIDKHYFNFSDNDSISEEICLEFTKNVNRLSGLSTFLILKDTIQNIEVGFSDRLITIPPNSKITIKAEILSTSSFYLYATTPSKWYSLCNVADLPAKHPRRVSSNRDLCCEKEKWECIVGSTSDVLGLFPAPLLSCIPSLIDLGTFTTFEIMCGNGNSTKDNIKNYFANFVDNRNGNQISAIQKITNTVLGCFGLGILKKIDKYREKFKDLEKSRKLALTQMHNYNSLYAKYLNEYEKTMKKADNLYNQGKIAEAEKLKEQAKGLKWEADNYKKLADEKYEFAEECTQEMNKVESDIDEENLKINEGIDYFKKGIDICNMIKNDFLCTNERLDAKKRCYPNSSGGGGNSRPAVSYDPNDIHGYLSESGSKFITDTVAKVNYTIEFENDPKIATAAAHTIVINDTLDSRYFDYSLFNPTGIRIGEHRVFLDETDVRTKNNVTSFVKTIDMRPEINAIAQVDGTFSSQTGIAQWKFTSLDPITMEPTNELIQGILPVNSDGISGTGEVVFEVGMMQGKSDGATINNLASIIFDFNVPILTPTWTNIVDAVAPTSTISDLSILNDTTIHITADAYDARSGVWKYEWYVQCGEDAPWWKEGETDTLCFDYRIYEDIDYGFCVLATDSAGNVEQKVLLRESRFKIDEYGNVETYIETPKDSGGNTPPVIYDLSGRRLTKPQENRINIIGRKKVLYRKYKQ